jgi:hypothetical protein
MPPIFFPQNPNDPDPQPNPDTPPDSADPTGVCPRCGRTSNFRAVAPPIPLTFTGLQVLERDGSTERDPAERVSGLLCMGCGDVTAVVEEKWVGQAPWRVARGRGGGTIRWRGIHWWPPVAVAGISDAVPGAIRACFEEGLRCLSAQAPRGAAVMFRRTLEAIVRDKGSQAAVAALTTNLATALKVMADEHTITPDLAEWAKEIRLAGNAGGHFDPIDDVDIAEADDMSRLLRSLLIYLYEVGSQIRRARGAAQTSKP